MFFLQFPLFNCLGLPLYIIVYLLFILFILYGNSILTLLDTLVIYLNSYNCIAAIKDLNKFNHYYILLFIRILLHTTLVSNI